MLIDLVHTQPLFREGPDTLVVRYTHPETGVNLEIPYTDLVDTVVAVDQLLSATDDEVVEEPPPLQEADPESSASIDDLITAAPSAMRVVRSRVADDAI